MENYNFYYEADKKHNPKKEPVWTDVYLDPAGKGWMISLIAPIYKNRYLKEISNRNNIRGIYLNSYPNFNFIQNINNKLTEIYQMRNTSSILHDLYYPEHLINYNRFKILTIHDTIHEIYNNLYKKDYYFFRKKIIEKYQSFICVSEKTKEDFVNFYNVDDSKVHVIHHGFEHLINTKIENISNSNILNKPFILYVGGRYKYKNFNLLAEAYSKNKIINENFNIICYGGEKISKQEINYFYKLGIENKIINIRGNDNILKGLYLKSKLFVSTSEYEGFGLTILEAIFLKCKILCNDINVFRRLYKNSINYFNFNDINHLIFQLENLLINKIDSTSDDIKETIIKKYTWKNCATNTEKLYKLFVK